MTEDYGLRNKSHCFYRGISRGIASRKKTHRTVLCSVFSAPSKTKHWTFLTVQLALDQILEEYRGWFGEYLCAVQPKQMS